MKNETIWGREFNVITARASETFNYDENIGFKEIPTQEIRVYRQVEKPLIIEDATIKKVREIYFFKYGGYNIQAYSDGDVIEAWADIEGSNKKATKIYKGKKSEFEFNLISYFVTFKAES